MEEKKLTDEQIIMAYKYCVIDNVDCKNCPCDNWGCGIDRKDIFGLINRQKSEIERLKDEKQKVIQDYYAESQHCDEQKDIIAKQKAEIERLNDMKFTQEHCDLYKENEWLKASLKQAVKDKAKEIFTDLLKEFSIRKSCGNADVVVREMAQRKGVEVEK